MAAPTEDRFVVDLEEAAMHGWVPRLKLPDQLREKPEHRIVTYSQQRLEGIAFSRVLQKCYFHVPKKVYFS